MLLILINVRVVLISCTIQLVLGAPISPKKTRTKKCSWFVPHLMRDRQKHELWYAINQLSHVSNRLIGIVGLWKTGMERIKLFCMSRRTIQALILTCSEEQFKKILNYPFFEVKNRMHRFRQKQNNSEKERILLTIWRKIVMKVYRKNVDLMLRCKVSFSPLVCM